MLTRAIETGDGKTQEDIAEAIRTLSKAISDGDSDTQSVLTRAIETGDGKTQDDLDAAIRTLSKAISDGDSDTQSV